MPRFTPQPFTFGPAEIFVGTGTDGAPELLGFTQAELRGTLTAEHEPLYCSVSGPRVPFDRIFLGETGQFSGDISVLDHTVLDKLMSRFPGMAASNTVPLPAPGIVAPNRLGTMMRLEGASFVLWLRSRYYNKTVFGQRGMPRGMRFPVCNLGGSVPFNLSVQPKQYSIVFEVDPLVDLFTGQMTLYDTSSTSMDGLPVY